MPGERAAAGAARPSRTPGRLTFPCRAGRGRPGPGRAPRSRRGRRTAPRAPRRTRPPPRVRGAASTWPGRRRPGRASRPSRAALRRSEPATSGGNQYAVHGGQHRPHRLPVVRLAQGPGADREGEGPHAAELRRPDQSQIAARLAVVEDAAPAEHQQVQAREGLEQRPVRDALPGRHLVRERLVRAGVPGVAAEDDQARLRAEGAQAGEDTGEDRLVTRVQAAVRAEHSDTRLRRDERAPSGHADLLGEARGARGGVRGRPPVGAVTGPVPEILPRGVDLRRTGFPGLRGARG
ncbi:hypothetical protein SGRIM128S_01517 [Streptomyces griseomycini]